MADSSFSQWEWDSSAEGMQAEEETLRYFLILRQINQQQKD